MKKVWFLPEFLVFLFLAVLPPLSLPGQSIPGKWELTFSDEFEGTSLDQAKWRSGYHFNAVINKEKQHYVPENLILDGSGILKVKAEKRTVSAPPMKFEQPYASGAIETWDRFTQTYGLFEARIKQPSAKGLWTAFWLMPDRGKELENDKRMSTFDGGMEFDIMEYLPVWGEFYHTAMLYDGYGSKKQGRSGGGEAKSPHHRVPGIGQDFHTYSLYWEKGRAMFFVDGRVVHGWTDERVASVPMHVILCMAVGGQWPETYGPVDDNALPDTMEVDWVRVYKGTLDTSFPVPDFENFPYQLGGVPFSVPGVIPGGRWNCGREATGFQDKDKKARKRMNVDKEPEYLAKTAEGEWFNYTVRVPSAGSYRLTVRGRSKSETSVRFFIDGKTDPIAVFSKVWGENWSEESAQGIELPSGEYKLKLVFSGEMDLDSIKFDL